LPDDEQKAGESAARFLGNFPEKTFPQRQDFFPKSPKKAVCLQAHRIMLRRRQMRLFFFHIP
jgi:hypothetical protein